MLFRQTSLVVGEMADVGKVAVAGGTGLVGRKVVELLGPRDIECVPLARSMGVDITTGQGLAEALQGVNVIIDVSNVTTMRKSVSARFFGSASERLLSEGARAGVHHHIALSIINCDRVPYGYYEGKVIQEKLVLADAVRGTVLRAAQFHEFAEQMLGRGFGRLAVIPRMRTQPVAAQEVAEELVSLAEGMPVGRAPDLAGPQEEDLEDMVRRLLDRRGDRRLLLSMRLPGAAGRAMADGGLLPSGPGRRGRQDFAAWLGE